MTCYPGLGYVEPTLTDFPQCFRTFVQHPNMKIVYWIEDGFVKIAMFFDTCQEPKKLRYTINTPPIGSVKTRYLTNARNADFPYNNICFLLSYTLRRLYRWELSAKNKVIKELRERREAKGLWLIDAVSRLTNCPKEDVAVIATVITSSLTYLVLLEENCPVYNGFKLQSETGWEQLEKGIDALVDQWIKNYTNE